MEEEKTGGLRARGRPHAQTEAERLREYRSVLSAADAKRAKRLRETNAQELRGKIKTGRVLARLQQCLDGEIELSPSQVRAAGMLLDRTMPVLSSQELHHHDESAGLSEAELLARLEAMLSSLPAGVQQAVAAALNPTTH